MLRRWLGEIHKLASRLPWSESAKDEFGSRKHQTWERNKTNCNQILRTPSKWLPFDLNAWALHSLSTHWFLRQIKTSPFHSQLLNTLSKSSIIILLSLQLPGHLPVTANLNLNQRHKHKRSADRHKRRYPPILASMLFTINRRGKQNG